MSCEQCGGSCEACGGCRVLELTPSEIRFLNELGQYAFLPVARRADDMTPVYLEDDRETPENYSLILQCMEKKGLITLDYGSPLIGADIRKYAAYPIHGSIALTQRGQQVLDLIQINGI